jgi:tetratricopeptide (TPR) repeat protein
MEEAPEADAAPMFSNLAAAYKRIGRTAEARGAYEHALRIEQRALGTSHPGYARTLNNLACLCREEGRAEDAERLYQRALKVLEHALGPDHQDVAMVLNNMANLYRDQGRLEEAASLMKRVLALSQGLACPNPRDTAAFANNLAEVYRRQQRFSEAIASYGLALENAAQVMTWEHPERELIAKNLLDCIGELWRSPGGLQHPAVPSALDALAGLHVSRGKPSRGLALLQRALEENEATLGPYHPITEEIRTSLRSWRAKVGDSSDPGGAP